jgi:hypothetical protein
VAGDHGVELQELLQISQGLGKMNSDTWKAEQMTCHSTITAAAAARGTSVPAFVVQLFMAMSWALIG